MPLSSPVTEGVQLMHRAAGGTAGRLAVLLGPVQMEPLPRGSPGRPLNTRQLEHAGPGLSSATSGPLSLLSAKIWQAPHRRSRPKERRWSLGTGRISGSLGRHSQQDLPTASRWGLRERRGERDSETVGLRVQTGGAAAS